MSARQDLWSEFSLKKIGSFGCLPVKGNCKYCGLHTFSKHNFTFITVQFQKEVCVQTTFNYFVKGIRLFLGSQVS